MGDVLLPANIGDLISSEVMAAEFLYLLADRDAGLLTHPALIHVMPTDPTSLDVKVRHLGLGSDLASAVTPGSEIDTTTFQDGSTTVTLGMRAIRRNVNDLARLIGKDVLNPTLWALDAAVTVGQTVLSLLANVGDDYTAYVGTSGSDLTWFDILDAQTTLGIAKVSGETVCLLHPRQWGDLKGDAASLGAVPAMTMAGVLNQGLAGAYMGRWMGTDFYVSSHCPTGNAGADRVGFMCGRGGLIWSDAELPPVTGTAGAVFNLGRARIEQVRQGQMAAESWITSMVVGVATGIDAAGVSIKSDA